MTANQIKIKAWSQLTDKWGTFAGMIFVYFLIILGLSLLSIVGVGAIGILLLTGPFTVGFAIASLHVARKEELRFGDMFGGFKVFGKALALDLLNNIFVFLWSLLFYIPGIVKSYSYSMSYYILADNPTMSQSEARRASMRMMRGHKWHLFCLHCSFVGWWIIVTPLTLGIFTFWLIPYMNTANAIFYNNLKKEAEEDMLLKSKANTPVYANAQPRVNNTYVAEQPVRVVEQPTPVEEPTVIVAAKPQEPQIAEEPVVADEPVSEDVVAEEQVVEAQPRTEEQTEDQSAPVEILLDDDDQRL
jgi:uncharacterized membrane protein